MPLEILKTKNLVKADIITAINCYNNFIELGTDFDSLELEQAQIKKIINFISDDTSPVVTGLLSLMWDAMEDYPEACKYAFLCMERSLPVLKRSAFELCCNAQIENFNSFLKKDNFDAAKNEIKKLKTFARKNANFDTAAVFNNIIESLKSRLEDYELIHSKIISVDREIAKQQWKLIEILGVFASIITFVFTSVTIIAKIDNILEIKFLLIRIALLLMIIPFMLSLMVDFESKNRTLKFLFLILLLTLVFADMYFNKFIPI